MVKDVCNLIYESIDRDDDGFETVTEVSTQVYCEKKSVTRTEFYQAQQSGTTPSNIFKMRLEDYEQTLHNVDGIPVYADILEYKQVRYKIQRTFEKGNFIEVTCYVQH